MKKLFRTSLLVLGLSYCYSLSVLAQWSTHTLSLPRFGMAAASVGDKALFAGGYYSADIYSVTLANQIDVYDGITNQWTTAQLASPRQGITTLTVNNLVFFAGGRNANYSYYGSIAYDGVDIYNVDTDQWTSTRLSWPRYNIGVASASGKVFFGGGTSDIGNINYYSFGGIDIYDIATNKWSVIKLPRLAGALQAVSVHDKILFYGKPVYPNKLYPVDI